MQRAIAALSRMKMISTSAILCLFLATLTLGEGCKSMRDDNSDRLIRSRRAQPSVSPVRGTDEPVDHEMSKDQAIDILSRTERFVVSFEGEQAPREWLAVQLLLNDGEGGAVSFKTVMNVGSKAGQLYALCGMYLKDKVSFQKYMPTLRKSNDEITMVSGSLSDQVTVGQIVYDPDAVAPRHGESFAEMMTRIRHPELGVTVNVPLTLDIAGGGLPYRIGGYANEVGIEHDFFGAKGR